MVVASTSEFEEYIEYQLRVARKGIHGADLLSGIVGALLLWLGICFWLRDRPTGSCAEGGGPCPLRLVGLFLQESATGPGLASSAPGRSA